jgi:outer membrane immunogenic protein
MRYSKLIFSAAVAISAIAGIGAADAADLPARTYTKAPTMVDPGVNWSGFYIGVNAGWIGSSSGGVTNTGTDTFIGGLGGGLIAGSIPTSIGVRNSGFLGGGQVGYNWQAANFVYGLEADFDGITANASSTFGPSTAAGAAETTIFTRQTNWLGTFRGRLGVTLAPSFLLFGTGGLAVGQTKLGATFLCPTCLPDPTAESTTSNLVARTATGWTAGAGAEWMFAPSWSVKAEYLYVDLGRQASTIVYTYPAANVSTMTSTARNTDNIVRAGVNYHFSGPGVSKY